MRARIEVVLIPLGHHLHVLGILGVVLKQEHDVLVDRVGIYEGRLQLVHMVLGDSTSSQLISGHDHPVRRDFRTRVLLGDAILLLDVIQEHLPFVHRDVCTGA